MKINATILKRAIVDKLKKYGIAEQDALFIAHSFIMADLHGYPQHGSMRIKQLIEGINNKNINSRYSTNILKDTEVVTVIDAKRSIGQIAAKQAVEISIKKAKKFGVGISGVINASHIGRLALYTELAQKEDCICIAMSTSSPAVSFNGGYKKVLGTNPVAYAVPSLGDVISADFSTSKVSRGRVFEKILKKEKMPKGWCIDKMGNSTENPEVIQDGGSLLPFDDGVKASMLSLLISILAGPFIGGVNNTKVVGTRHMDKASNKGDFFITLHIPHFTEVLTFYEKIDELKKIIENDESSFRVPGNKACSNYIENLKKGIEIDEKTYQIIAEYISKEEYAQK